MLFDINLGVSSRTKLGINDKEISETCKIHDNGSRVTYLETNNYQPQHRTKWITKRYSIKNDSKKEKQNLIFFSSFFLNIVDSVKGDIIKSKAINTSDLSKMSAIEYSALYLKADFYIFWVMPWNMLLFCVLPKSTFNPKSLMIWD